MGIFTSVGNWGEATESAGNRGSLGLGGMCVLQDLGNNKGLTSSRLVAMRPGSALEALNEWPEVKAEWSSQFATRIISPGDIKKKKGKENKKAFYI